MLYDKNLTASLVLANATSNSSEGNWNFSEGELREKYGIENSDELKEVVDTINDLYPEALLDDPIEQAEKPGELSLMLAGEWTLSYWEDKEPLCGAPTTAILFRLRELDEAFEEMYLMERLYDNARETLEIALGSRYLARRGFNSRSKSFVEFLEGAA